MGDFDITLIGGYHVVRYSPDVIEVLHTKDSSHLGVLPKVCSLAWDQRFILVKQQEVRPRGSFTGDEFPVPVPGKFHYWIIDTLETKRYGPMGAQDFDSKVVSFGLNQLKLKNVEDLKR